MSREETPFTKPRRAKSSANNSRRGRGWEAQLKVWHDAYRARGEAWLVHTSPGIKRVGGAGRTFEATFSSKGPPDFVGAICWGGPLGGGPPSGRPVVFDAKDCEADRWPLSKLDDHQATDLSGAARAGAVAFVALRGPFGSWVLPWGEPHLLGSYRRPRPGDALRARWEHWRAGRAAVGEASLTVEDMRQFGFPMDVHGWLSVVHGLIAEGGR